MAEAVTRTLGGSAAWYGRQSLPVGIPRLCLGTRAIRGQYEGNTRAIRGRERSGIPLYCLLPLTSCLFFPYSLFPIPCSLLLPLAFPYPCLGK